MLHDGINVLTAEEMSKLDEFTINNIGIPGAVLMENAGRAVVDAFEEHFEPDSFMRTAIFCGKGNNGGDGFVIARHLESRGYEVEVFLLCEMAALKDDARIMAAAAENIGITIHEIPDAASVGEIEFDPRNFAFIFDAIFGTGLSSAVRGHYLGIIDLINASGRPVIAVDIPSGLSSDSGQLIGPAVTADLTVTFAYPKRGLLLTPASKMAGQVVVADISIPEVAEDDSLNTVMITALMIRNLDLEREVDSHKGSFGHVCVVAGSIGKSGAAALTGMGALRSGSGLVTVATPQSLAAQIPQFSPELMTLPLEEEHGEITIGARDALKQAEKTYSALAIGPGLGTSEMVGQVIRNIVRDSTVPVVLDADGISAFVNHLEELQNDRVPLIITPHPGEMARLTGMTVEAVQNDRIEVARKLATERGIVVVLKGHRSIIADTNGDVYINDTGNPGMATGGSGDVLTGMIASLVGRDFTPLESAVAGVYLHGLAGDKAMEDLGMASLAASDIIGHLPQAFEQVESE